MAKILINSELRKENHISLRTFKYIYHIFLRNFLLNHHIFLRTFRGLNREFCRNLRKKSKITTTFKREICRNLDKKVRLRQIFMNFLFNYLSTVEETLFLFIDLHFRKGLKILETGIAPFLCILQLYIEQRVCMLPFLFMPLHILFG